MSRPNGPVRHPGIPSQPENSSDPLGGHGGGGLDPNSYAGQQPTYQQPAGQTPQQPYPAPEQQSQFTQAQQGQGYAPTYAGPPQANAAGLDPAQATAGTAPASWADVNQPAQSTAYEGVDQTNFATPHAPQQPTAPAYGETQPAYDPGVTHQQPAQQAHYQQPYPSAQPTTPTAAPSGYDFAGYEAPHAAPQLDPAFQAPQDPAVDWGQAGFAPVGAAAPGPSADLGFATPAPGLDASQQPVHVEDGYAGEDDYDYEDEDDTGRGRGVLVAAALAGAIVIGGSMAYGYQALFGTPSSDKPPIVKGASGPAKVKPADPGGRKFAHTDSKIMGRLGSASGKTNDPSGGARRVSTLRIGRDGSVMPPSNPTAATAGGNRMVTGLTLGGEPVATTAAQAAAPKAPAANDKPIVVKPPVKKAPVKVVAAKPVAPKATKPTVAPVKKAAPAVTSTPAAAPKKVAVAKPAPVAVGPKPTGAGYVAVLASVPASKTSRMDSLKQFADMQQKYGAALANKTPDVQQANLGAKGTYHRLIAGPPGSAQSARQVCNDLKTAGYTSCWVLAY